MSKTLLLGAAMAMTAPALAQTAPATADVAPQADATAPAQTAQSAATAAASPAEQVAQAVDRQFANYDKDGDGKLNEAEFSTWMVALKSQTDPAIDATSPAITTWNKAAFAQADKDKSRSLTKTELTGFLSPAKS